MVNAGAPEEGTQRTAGKCDKSQANWGQCTLSGRRDAALQVSHARSMTRPYALQQVVPVYFPCPDGSGLSRRRVVLAQSHGKLDQQNNPLLDLAQA